MMATRVELFVDYENVRHGAREVFGDPRRAPSLFGHVLPQRLGVLVTQLGEAVNPDRELTGVTVYRGRPGPKSGPKRQSEFARRVAAWEAQPLVSVKTRPLRYHVAGRDNGGRAVAWRPQEKGIDVLMALDIAIGARDDLYDVAVVASEDSDLVPAVEAALDAGKRVETAMWRSPAEPRRRLRVPGHNVWNHKLDERKFVHLRDDTDYLALS